MKSERIYKWVKDECVPNIIDEYRNGNTDKDGIKNKTLITMENPDLNNKYISSLVINLKKRQTIEVRYFKTRQVKRMMYTDDDGNKRRISVLSTMKHIDYEDENILNKIYTKHRSIDSDILVAIIKALKDSKLQIKGIKDINLVSTIDYTGCDIPIIFDKKVLK